MNALHFQSFYIDFLSYFSSYRNGQIILLLEFTNGISNMPSSYVSKLFNGHESVVPVCRPQYQLLLADRTAEIYSSKLCLFLLMLKLRAENCVTDKLTRRLWLFVVFAKCTVFQTPGIPGRQFSGRKIHVQEKV